LINLVNGEFYGAPARAPRGDALRPRDHGDGIARDEASRRRDRARHKACAPAASIRYRP